MWSIPFVKPRVFSGSARGLVARLSVPQPTVIYRQSLGALLKSNTMSTASQVRAMQLPTLDRLGSDVDPDVSPSTVAENWFTAFTSAIQKGDSGAASALFLDDGFWRDILALTSDFRTVHGHPDISTLLHSSSAVEFSGLRLSQDPLRAPSLRKPFPDLTLLQFCFEFQTKIGLGTGICRLAPIKDGNWKAYTMFTCLDSLKDHPEKVPRSISSKPSTPSYFCATGWLVEGQFHLQRDLADQAPARIRVHRPRSYGCHHRRWP